MNILFICSRNKWRSRTAEAVFKNSRSNKVKSAGTEDAARIKVTGKMLHWADLIFVMENRHRQRLQEKFAAAISSKRIIVLGIPDDYKYMDEELVELLRNSVSPYLTNE